MQMLMAVNGQEFVWVRKQYQFQDIERLRCAGGLHGATNTVLFVTPRALLTREFEEIARATPAKHITIIELRPYNLSELTRSAGQDKL